MEKIYKDMALKAQGFAKAATMRYCTINGLEPAKFAEDAEMTVTVAPGFGTMQVWSHLGKVVAKLDFTKKTIESFDKRREILDAKS